METSNTIHRKLELFIKKYYTNELIRGILFFVGLGLIYLLFTLFIEYFLWLEPKWRSLLFLCFVAVELFLLLRFILFPVLKIFRFQKGINFEQAAKIIGDHFSEVNDTLLNYLQLSSVDHKSELLAASIDQKAMALRPVPFGRAVDFGINKRYLPLALLPLGFVGSFFISGNSSIISQSFSRVIHFNSRYAPPAPFRFEILNPRLVGREGSDFLLRVRVVGKVVPENVMIVLDEESYFMENVGVGEFKFKVENPKQQLTFHLEANKISSPTYELKLVAVPSISNFEMRLTYPSYLKIKPGIVKGSGNAVIPEGTTVSWLMQTKATKKVTWKQAEMEEYFNRAEDRFVFAKRIIQNTDYQIITSNERIKNFEKLNYRLTVVKDQYPSIQFEKAPDSLAVDSAYFIGQLSDDHGLSKLEIVYYESGKPSTAKRGTIAIKQENFDQVVYSFPGKLPLEAGRNYDFYFEVFDNDVLNHYKSSRSAVFSKSVLSQEQEQSKAMGEQRNAFDSMERSLGKQKEGFSELEKLQNMGKEKDGLDFNERQKLSNFIKEQRQQQQQLKKLADQLKEGLERSKEIGNDKTKEVLEKRLANTKKELEKNQSLLDELNELNNKIREEDLLEKLDQFKQGTKTQNKNLAQLVELTKRYYVEKKAEQLSDRLDKLGEKEDKLSDNLKENSGEEQKKLNEEFDKIQQELRQLEKDNKDLKNPMDIPSDARQEESIKDDMQKASSDLKNSNQSKAQKSQKSAAMKMKDMAKSMEAAMENSQKDQMQEDVKMLRQVLDNLLAYSFSQEELVNQFKSIRSASPSFGKYIRSQQNLKTQFKHIDDSLFALSLRQPKLAETVTKEVANVQYNIDAALDSFVESQWGRGLAQQQYAMSSANKLADMLSESLNNMQMQLSGGGRSKSGQGKDMQLPDIIKKQSELSDKIKSGMKPSQKPGEGTKPGSGADKKAVGMGSDTDGEGDAKATMEIYKEQKLLREALQEELQRKGVGTTGQQSLEQMKQLEKQLLNRGVSNESLQRAAQIKQELLKLETAIRLQGEDPKRQSESSSKQFSNEAVPLPKTVSDYLNSIEILNRQSLPLRSHFNQKVQVYFNNK